MSRNNVTDFFDGNAEQWVLNGYKDDGYNYPVALHRLRVIKKILSNYGSGLKIVDLGCGGGNVSLALAELGHNVTGIDGAENMVKLSNTLRSMASTELKKRVRFEHSPITNNKQKDGKFDVCIAMGVIGYFNEDSELFNEAKRLLKPGGIFLVSCRNQLFNMQSLSFRTESEINNNNATVLIKEIQTLYSRIPVSKSNEMVDKLKILVENLPNSDEYDDEKMKSPSEKFSNDFSYKPYYEPRQHSPQRLTESANLSGFDNISYHGIHPHLIDPNINKLLPPKIFNQLSSCLEVLEDLPISLTWSSVFIGVFLAKN
jgi:2-polyprenyl-3-methyl-5-hydroxy-6-metoxy-1,4-benzoquinol methylase